MQEPDYHEVPFDGSQLATGAYIYRIQSGRSSRQGDLCFCDLPDRTGKGLRSLSSGLFVEYTPAAGAVFRYPFRIEIQIPRERNIPRFKRTT